MATDIKSIIDHRIIENTLETTRNTPRQEVDRIIEKSLEMKGLKFEEIACLLNTDDEQAEQKLFDAANRLKNLIYGDRLVLFAPLYISNICYNDCAYCAFRVSNRELTRKALSQEEIEHEVKTLIDQGHKRLLMVAGEAFPRDEGFDFILKSIDTIYRTKSNNGEIRRLNVNIAPIEIEQFKALKAKGIGTYQLFQETYHLPTYKKVHLSGKKRDYYKRLEAIDLAFQAGIDDVGLGVLFGLYDYRYETLALMQHIKHLEDTFGVGCHTISVPRIEPAEGSPMSIQPPAPLSDREFKKLIAILRLAVPYTGIILSTRETPEARRGAFALGISQISAGSRTNPGGYAEDGEGKNCAQFSLGDHRSLDEVIRDISSLGYIPSFCTACYRLGRTGMDFMDMAKPGEIKYHCSPNAISTFMEYLLDYASEETKKVGMNLIEQKLKDSADERWKNIAKVLIEQVKNGKRDCFV
ncbi:MAG: [FeFe] hydrogenase H-cluster radical SAM maturase HydG [Vulcanimicrobiota bacterium]